MVTSTWMEKARPLYAIVGAHNGFMLKGGTEYYSDFKCTVVAFQLNSGGKLHYYGILERDGDPTWDVVNMTRNINDDAIFSGTEKQCMDWLAARIRRMCKAASDAKSNRRV